MCIPACSMYDRKGCVAIRLHIVKGCAIALSVIAGLSFVLSPNALFQRWPTLLLAHTLCGQLMRGHFNGWHNGFPAPVDFRQAQPGDIILCHNAHGAYGYWTHTAMYVGDGRAVDANDFSRGTVIWQVGHYRNYDQVMLVRPRTSSKVRSAAAQAAIQQVGKAYDPLGPLRDAHCTYCSKLVWQSYASTGFLLSTAHDWVLPDQIAHSPRVSRVATWSADPGTSACAD